MLLLVCLMPHAGYAIVRLSAMVFCVQTVQTNEPRNRIVIGSRGNTGGLVPHTHMTLANTLRTDLQVVASGTSAGNLALVMKQLRSIGVPTWDDLVAHQQPDPKTSFDCRCCEPLYVSMLGLPTKVPQVPQGH